MTTPCEDCNRLVSEKQDLRDVLAGLRAAGRQAYRQIGLFLEDGQRERLIVAQAILDPDAELEPRCGDCPEDWTVYSKFEARRWVQLTCERANEAEAGGSDA